MLHDPTASQRDAVTHAGGPLLIVGGPGTGKTEALVQRLRWLWESGGRRVEQVLVLAHGERAAAALRTRIQGALAGAAFEELHVHSVRALCGKLLAASAPEAGIDAFTPVMSTADSVAMLLEERTARGDVRHGGTVAMLVRLVGRIDALEAELIDAETYSRWAHEAGGEGEQELARLFIDHDRMLAERGGLSSGAALRHTVRLLESSDAVRERAARRWPELLVDDWQELSFGEREVVRLLEEGGAALTAAGDDDQALDRARGGGATNLAAFAAEHPDAATVTLVQSFRCPEVVLGAAQAVVAANEPRIEKEIEGEPGGEVRFWRCTDERSQAQSVARELQRLIAEEGVDPSRIAVLMRSAAREGPAVATALAERAVPHRVVGAEAFFQRTEIRDLLAWLRLLIDPRDAGAAVRALARPPIELSSVDIARCVQIARRRKLDVVGALGAAIESPQVPPEARERIDAFLRIYRPAAAALDSIRPEVFVLRLVDRLGMGGQQLFTARADSVERLANLAHVVELAAAHTRRAPQSTPREFATYVVTVAEAGLGEEREVTVGDQRVVFVGSIDAARELELDHVFVIGLHAGQGPGDESWGALAPIPDELVAETLPPATQAAHAEQLSRLIYVAMTRAWRGVVLSYARDAEDADDRQPSPHLELARSALGAEWEDRSQEPLGGGDSLQATAVALRDELMQSIPKIGGRLDELRLDTDRDISHGVVRFLELVKLSALLQRPAGQPLAEALDDLNARISAAVTSHQRELLGGSPLDAHLLASRDAESGRAAASAAHTEPSLEAFLPRQGAGLVLSASDIETYRTCPLRYKFARVLRIPSEPTLAQRFGILIHKVLERYHSTSATSQEQLLVLLEAGWRRGGFGDSDEELRLYEMGRAALLRYHDRLGEQQAVPRHFERSFSFMLGAHRLRGRVDRVDELPGGGYELIDYKTGRPKTAVQLRDDVQLAVYEVAAREAWQLEATQRSYYYLLDDEKVPVPGGDSAWIGELVEEVAAGILAQDFEPKPSYAVCSRCDFRIACPAAER